MSAVSGGSGEQREPQPGEFCCRADDDGVPGQLGPKGPRRGTPLLPPPSAGAAVCGQVDGGRRPLRGEMCRHRRSPQANSDAVSGWRRRRRRRRRDGQQTPAALETCRCRRAAAIAQCSRGPPARRRPAPDRSGGTTTRPASAGNMAPLPLAALVEARRPLRPFRRGGRASGGASARAVSTRRANRSAGRGKPEAAAPPPRERRETSSRQMSRSGPRMAGLGFAVAPPGRRRQRGSHGRPGAHVEIQRLGAEGSGGKGGKGRRRGSRCTCGGQASLSLPRSPPVGGREHGDLKAGSKQGQQTGPIAQPAGAVSSLL